MAAECERWKAAGGGGVEVEVVYEVGRDELELMVAEVIRLRPRWEWRGEGVLEMAAWWLGRNGTHDLGDVGWRKETREGWEWELAWRLVEEQLGVGDVRRNGEDKDGCAP